MRAYTLVQGHPYSNDDGEDGITLTEKGRYGWAIVLGIIIGVVLLVKYGPRKKS